LQAEATEPVVLHAIRFAHAPVPVAQQRIVDPILFLEHPVTVVAVRADPEHLGAVRLDRAEGVPDRAELALTHIGEVEHVEREHDGTVAEFLRERHGLRLVVQQREIGRLLADVHHGHRLALGEPEGNDEPFASSRA